MVPELADYPWSSHRGYLANAKGWDWLHRKILLAMFSNTQQKAFSSYIDFIKRQDSEEVQQFYSRKSLPSIFGSAEFIDRIRNRFYSLRENNVKKIKIW